MQQLLSGIFSACGIQADSAPFERYCDMLLEKNKVMNLTAITEPSEVCTRHFADSLALLSAADFHGARVIDVGCGAGFPGLPLRLAEPSLSLTLLDSNGKRVDFLSEVCAALSLSDVSCIHERAEELAAKPEYREAFDIAVSRAVASLPMLCELTLPFVRTGGAFLAMKSRDCGDELDAAKNAIRLLGGELEDKIDYPLYNTDITHSIIVIRKNGKTPAKYPRRFSKIKASPL